jgi:hypothetical protein
MIAQRTPYQRAIDRLGDLADLGCERGLSAREHAEYIRLDNAVKAYEAMSPAQREREAVWAALSTEEHQARVREAYESRGSDPRVEAAQEPRSSQDTEHPAWFLTPSREGDSVRYEMSEAVYDEWRLASPTERPAVEQTIQGVAERYNGPGQYDVLTPHGDTAFSFTVPDGHQQELFQSNQRPLSFDEPQLSFDEERCNRLELEHEGTELPDYPTQYAGSMGSAPNRIEIDTSDPEMGQRWQDQLAALDARLGAFVQEQTAHQQHHEQELRY